MQKIEIKGAFPAAVQQAVLVLATLAFVTAPPVAAEDVTVRKADGVILAAGRPFFPIGMYHVSHFPKQDAMRLADLGVLAQAGFNVVATPLSLKNGGSFLEQANRLGVRVLVEANDPAGIHAVVKGLRGHPAVLAWLTYDDIDDGTITPEDAFKMHHEIKALHPDRPTYASGAYTERIAGFAGRSDLLAMQTYPIPDEDLSATSVSVAVAVKAATDHHQSVIGNCQAFAWPKKRAPTPAELRNMTFQSVIAGVKGMIYYTCFDETGHLFENKELWRECKALAGELGELGPVLLDGERVTLAVETTDDVRAACWTDGKRKYVIVCNVSRMRQNVVIQLPKGVEGELRPAFAGRPSGLTLRDRTLSGEMEPIHVHVYALDEGLNPIEH